MLDKSIILESDRLLLRPIEVTDIDAMIPLCSDAKMWTWFTADLSVKEELREWIQSGIADPNRMAFTVFLKDSQEVIGSTSIGNISPRDKRAEIGWTWLAKAYQGKGINSEVKHLLLKHLFEVMQFIRVEFKTDVLNIAARKGLLKAGAVEEGILRSHTLMTHDRRRDTIFYSVLRSEWPNIKKS